MLSIVSVPVAAEEAQYVLRIKHSARPEQVRRPQADFLVRRR